MGDAKEAKLLKKRVAICESSSLLYWAKDLVTEFEEQDLHSHFQNMMEGGEAVPLRIRMKVVAAYGIRALKKLQTSEANPQEVQKAIAAFVDSHAPVLCKDDKPQFKLFEPLFSVLLRDAMAEDDQTLHEHDLQKAITMSKSAGSAGSEGDTAEDTHELLGLADWLATSRALIDSFANDITMDLVEKCNSHKFNKEASHVLLCIAKRMAICIQDSNNIGSDDRIPVAIIQVQARIRTWCFTVICSFDPRPHYLGASVKDMFIIAKYKASTYDDDILETTLRDALKTGTWKEIYECVQKTASAAREFAPKIADFKTKLKELQTDSELAVIFAAVMPALDMWADFQPPNLRPNAVTDLEVLLTPAITTIAKMVATSDSLTVLTDIGMDLDMFVAKLEKLTGTHALDDVASLKKWKEQNRRGLAEATCDKFLLDSIEVYSKNSADSKFDSHAFLKHLQQNKGRTQFKEDHVKQGVSLMIKRLTNEAGVCLGPLHHYYYYHHHY